MAAAVVELAFARGLGEWVPQFGLEIAMELVVRQRTAPAQS